MEDGKRLREGGKAALDRFRAWPRWLRVTLGLLLIIGGILGFLPVLGFWMLPLGLAILAIDIPLAARAARRIERGLEHLFRRWRRP